MPPFRWFSPGGQGRDPCPGGRRLRDSGGARRQGESDRLAVAVATSGTYGSPGLGSNDPGPGVEVAVTMTPTNPPECPEPFPAGCAVGITAGKFENGWLL
jgi:hypothetical protein